MEGNRKEDSKLSLPLVGVITCYFAAVLPLLASSKLRLNLASNSLQNQFSGKAVNNNKQ